MSTILDTLEPNVNPKQRILDLINFKNGTNLTLADVNFTTPEIPPTTNRIRNTKIFLVPTNGSNFYGVQEVWYNRIHGSALGVINVTKGSAVSVYTLLTAINNSAGILLTSDDVYDATLPAPDAQGKVNVTLNFKPTSYLFYGGAVLSLFNAFTQEDRDLLNALQQAVIGLSNVNPMPLAASADPGVLNISSRGDHVHPLPPTATASTNGLMSSTDKNTLLTLAAQTYIQLTSASPLPLAATASVGTATTAAHADHVHALPPVVNTGANGLMTSTMLNTLNNLAAATYIQLTSALPATLGTAAVGVAATAARADHVHQLPVIANTGSDGLMSAAMVTTLNTLNSATYIQLTNSTPTALGTVAVGTGLSAARWDHVHPLPAVATTGNNGLMSAAMVSTLANLGSAAYISTTDIAGYSTMTIVEMTTSLVASANCFYLIRTPGVILTLPPGFAAKTKIGFANCSNSTNVFIDFNGQALQGWYPAVMTLDDIFARSLLTWSGNAAIGFYATSM